MQRPISTKAQQDFARKIELYYIANIDTLTKGKQTHFFSRLYLWSGRLEYVSEVNKLAPEYAMKDLTTLVRSSLDLREEKRSKQCKLSISKAFRCEYKDLLDDISAYNKIFFKVMFAYTLYGHDERTALIELISIDDVQDIRRRLLEDHRALFALSTPAVNFLYLVQWAYPNKDVEVDTVELLDIGVSQTLDVMQSDIHSRIYLLTHCIINKTLFYHQSIINHGSIYNQMITVLEQYIEKYYDAVSLDQKCEFLVCARLLKKETSLRGRIFKECASSLSLDGHFIVDIHNEYKQFNVSTLTESEHRNVLCIMAFG